MMDFLSHHAPRESDAEVIARLLWFFDALDDLNEYVLVALHRVHHPLALKAAKLWAANRQYRTYETQSGRLHSLYVMRNDQTLFVVHDDQPEETSGHEVH